MKRKLLLLCLFLVFGAAWQVVAQDRTVTGRVTSADDGTALPGVNVVVRGSSSGTVTDAQGRYSITAPTNSTLVFTFVGLLSQEIPVGNQSTVDVQMAADVKQLTEVVVTAQGIERTKNELPYAAQQVAGEQVSRTRDNNFVNALSGKVSGLQITRNNTMGGSTNVVIRGNKSLTGNNQALFIVDGVPIDNANYNTPNQRRGGGGYDYGNAAADINPDDIASVNVLKGAAATALYGSRAANGVILITTKKGSKGLGVTVNSGVTLGYINKNTFPTFQKGYGAGYGRFYGADTDDDGNPDQYFNQVDVNGDGQPDQVVPTTEDASYGAPFDPNLQVYQWDSFDPRSPNFGQPRPWVAAANDPTNFLETSVMTSNTVSIDGGNDQGYFKLGYSRNSEKGILPNSNLVKDFVNFGGGYNVTKRIKAEASVNFTNQRATGRYGTGYDDKNVATNFRQWWQTNVDVQDLKDAYFRNGENVTWNWADPTDISAGPIYWDNPYWTRYENYQNDNRLRYFGNVSLNYQVTDWLNLLGRVSLDTYNHMQEERYAVGSLSPAQYQRYNQNFSEFNYDAIATFNKNLTESFNVRAVAGLNVRKTKVQSLDASTNGGLVIPRLYSLANSLQAVQPPTETYTDLQVNGLYGSITLGYKGLVFVDVTGRRDEASSLPAGNNVFYYPSVSGSFVFSELLKSQNWLTSGKVRANYAQVGNTALPGSSRAFYDLPLVGGETLTAFDGSPLFSVPGTRNNPELKPEITKSFEAGLEMSFLQDRVGFDFSYYKTNTVNQILPLSVSTATGYNFLYVNAGNIQNQGVELSAYVTPVRTATGFSWTVNANWTRNRSQVLELYPGITNYQFGAFQGGVSINAAVGQPYGAIRGRNFVYHENGQPIVGTNGYYRRSTTSNEIIGNITPDWIGGINNTFRYKTLSFNFLIDVRAGGDVFSLDQAYGQYTGIYPETAGTNDLGNPVRNTLAEGGGVILPGVKEDGSPNDVRARADDTNNTPYGIARNPVAAFVYDASFVKLREVALTFGLPQGIISRMGPFKGAELSIIGRNLSILHKNLPYADPEDGLGSGNYQSGFQSGSYPTTRNIGFNVRLKF